MFRQSTKAARGVLAYRIFGYPAIPILCVAWTLVGTVAYARHYLEDPAGAVAGGLLRGYFIWLTCFAPWVVLSPVAFTLQRRFPLTGHGKVRRLVTLAALSVPITYVGLVMTFVLGVWVQASVGRSVDVRHMWTDPGRELLIQQVLFWSSVAAGWMLGVLDDARENERRAARLLLEKSQLETSLRQAELDALRMRLHPHFLFNSLQNISVLMQHDPQTASRMLTKLGDLLRASLRHDAAPETTLQAEIALTGAYLAIEQMRFGNRLSSHVELGTDTGQALVPTSLLQPLVENAIRHGLRDIRERGVILIRSHIERGALVLSVCDNGAGPSPEALSSGANGAEPRSVGGGGIGLGATRERLARMYPQRHTFSIRAMPEGGTEVRITLPLRFDDVAETAADARAATVDR